MSTQSRKHSLGLAGEFFVAAELLRRGVLASVTYGNAKKADVVALSPSGRNAVVIEVKTTSSDSWIVGNSVPPAGDGLWVFVYLPPSEADSPKYFVLTSTEVHEIVGADFKAYRERFRAKNNREFAGAAVQTLSRTKAQPHEGKWEKVLSRASEG